MRNKIAIGIQVVLFTVLLMGAIYLVSGLLEYKDAKREYSDFYKCGTDVDVLFFGTSHMYNSIFPQVLWNEMGITSYNWGYSNSTMPISYYLIQEVIKIKKPKVVVVDLFGLTQYEKYNNGKYRTDRVEQMHIQFDTLPLTVGKYKAAKDIFDDYDGNIDFCYDFIKFHNRWEELSEGDFNIDYSLEKGAQMLVGHAADLEYVPYFDAGYFVNEFNYSLDTEIASTVCYEYLIKLLEYCRDNNITLLCTYFPFPADGNEQLEAYVLKDIFEEYENCDYIDMFESPYLEGIDMDTDINFDGSHVNYSGGYKISMMMGDVLKEKYNVPDHRSDKNYLSWNESYDNYVEFKKNKLSDCEEIIDLIMLIRGNDFSMTIVENQDSDIVSGDSAANKLIDSMQDNITYSKSDIEDAAIITVYDKKTGEEIVTKTF